MFQLVGRKRDGEIPEWIQAGSGTEKSRSGFRPEAGRRDPGGDSGRKRDGVWLPQGGSRIPKARSLGHPPEIPERILDPQREAVGVTQVRERNPWRVLAATLLPIHGRNQGNPAGDAIESVPERPPVDAPWWTWEA